MVYEGLNPGDETRRNGDYVGFPHNESDGTAVGSISGPDRGEPAAFNGSELVAVTGDGADDIAGVVYAYPVSGDSSRDGPYVEGDSDVTVKTRGTVIADLTAYVEGAATDPTEGAYVDDNNDLYVAKVVDDTNNLYEVVLR